VILFVKFVAVLLTPGITGHEFHSAAQLQPKAKPQMNTDKRLSFFPESLADLAFSNIPQRLRKETVELNRSPMGIVSANWSGKLW